MPHFITVPEITDSSRSTFKVKNRILNTDHIVSFSANGPDRVSVQTTKDTLDVLLPSGTLITLCSPEVVVTGGKRKLTPEDLNLFIARSQEPMVVMEPGMDHSDVRKRPVGLGQLGEPQLGESVEWSYPEVQLVDVQPLDTCAAVESAEGVKLYKLAGYDMKDHPHRSVVTTALINRYKSASQQGDLPACRRLRVVQADRPLMIKGIMGWVFQDYTADGNSPEYALTSEMMYRKKPEAENHDYLIREAVPHQDITIGPLYLIVQKANREFVLYNVYSNARTSHVLRQVYHDVSAEYTRRNLAAEIGDPEVMVLGRAATYNHETVIFHVNPYSDEFDNSDTQSWTVDRNKIVVPEKTLLNKVNKGN